MVPRITFLSFLAFLLFVVQSCKKEDSVIDDTEPCAKTRDTLELTNPYNSWFSEISSVDYANRITIFHSNNGLSVSMDILKYDVSYNESVIRNELHVTDFDPCVDHKCNGYLITNTSSMYNFSFDYKIYPYGDGIHICTRDFGSTKYGFMFYDYNLTTNEGNNIIYHIIGTYKSELIPTCENITLNVNGENLNVYKIVNTLAMNEGVNLDIVAIYIEKSKGIVRFDQKNGVFWEFEN